MQELDILIVGAGVAGLTCAALLEKQGCRSTIVERQSRQHFNDRGYMLGLLPLGGRVLNQLDLRSDYYSHSVEMDQYEIHAEDGRLIQRYPLDFINRDFGSYRGISRQELINLLRSAIKHSDLMFDTTVDEIRHLDQQVDVRLSSQQTRRFDLVIIADGLHSTTREQILNKGEIDYSDTHWGGWIAWLERSGDNVYREYWGASSFMGLYPVRQRIGVFLGGPVEHIRSLGIREFIARERSAIDADASLLHKALDALVADPDPYFWSFQDCKCRHWTRDRTVLLGDAAAGFLPTAGVGASMAMDSAAALVDELSRSDGEHLDYALKLYVNRQRQRVESAQEDSRQLGRMMFVKSSMVARIRDYAMRYYSLQDLVNHLSKTISGD